MCYIGGVGCPADWVRFKTSCYFFSTEKLNFDNAVQKCNGMSSSMVIIDDNEEQVKGEVTVGERYCFKILVSILTDSNKFTLCKQINQHCMYSRRYYMVIGAVCYSKSISSYYIIRAGYIITQLLEAISGWD